MADVSRLVLVVDSTDVKSASLNLDRLRRSGRLAEVRLNSLRRTLLRVDAVLNMVSHSSTGLTGVINTISAAARSATARLKSLTARVRSLIVALRDLPTSTSLHILSGAGSTSTSINRMRLALIRLAPAIRTVTQLSSRLNSRLASLRRTLLRLNSALNATSHAATGLGGTLSGVGASASVTTARISALASSVSALSAAMHSLPTTSLSSSLSATSASLHSTTTETNALVSGFGWLKGAIGALGLGVLVTELFQAHVALAKIGMTLQFATGSASGAAKEMDFLRKETERLGLNLQGAAKDYAKLAASSRGSSLEGQKTRDIFLAVAEASTVMGLSTDETSRIFNAFSQMISKGTIMSEELKGQVGEVLPGVFKMTADSINLTTRELSKLMETGGAVTDEILPKLAATLRQAVAGTLPSALHSASGELARFQNAWMKLKAVIADSGFIDAVTASLVGMTVALKVLNGTMDMDGSTVKFFEMLSSGALALAIVGLVSNFEKLTAAVAGLGRALGFVAVVAAGALASTAVVLGTVAAISAAAFTSIMHDFGGAHVIMMEFNEVGLEAARILKEIQDEARTARIADKELLKLFEEIDAHNAKIAADRAAKEAKDAEARVKRIADLEKELEGLQRRNEEFGKSARQIAALAVLRAVLNRNAAIANGQSQEEIRLLTKIIESTREHVQLLKVQDAIKKGDKAAKDAEKAAERAAKAQKKLLESLDKEIIKIKLRNEEIGKTKEQIEDLSIARGVDLIERRKADGASLQEIKRLEHILGLNRERISLLRKQRKIQADQKALKKAIELTKKRYDAERREIKRTKELARREAEKTANLIKTTLTSALFDAFESGKGFGASLVDSLKNLFETTVFRPRIEAVIGDFAKANPGLMEVLTWAGAVASGLSAGNQIAGDLRVVNGLSMTNVGAAAGGLAAGAYVGSKIGMIGGFAGAAIGAAIGAIVGGAADLLFGMGPKKFKDPRLQGAATVAGFEGRIGVPWTKKGGWFRSNKSGLDTSALPKDTQAVLNELVAGSSILFQGLITASGESARSLEDWRFAVDRVVKTEEQQEKLAIDLADSMAMHLIPELENLQRRGENLTDTAVRITDTFRVTDNFVTLLGQSISAAFGEVGLASGLMRSNLIDLMGGIQGASDAIAVYRQNFFSERERHTQNVQALVKNLAVLGVGDIPTSKAAYRQLVESQDLATAEGRRIAAGLIGLAPAFSSVAATSANLANAAPVVASAAPVGVVFNGGVSATDAKTANEARVMHQDLMAGLAAIANNTSNTADTLDTWDGNGLPAEAA